jgi:diguanylate cyclase (GGDEF)-like protein
LPNATLGKIADLWRRVWSRPEPEIAAAAFTGELLVAWVRLLIVLILAWIPASEYLLYPLQRDPRTLLATSLGALVGALLIYSAVRRNWGQSWMGFASSLLDVSLVSSTLVIFLLLGRPHEAINSMVVFPTYFLAIAATSLRYDARICLLTGGLGVVQYGAILLYATGHWDLNSAAFAPFEFGTFRWSDQVWRMAQLAGATVLAATMVVRSRELRLLSTRDRFTGLLNRAVFNEQLEQESELAGRDAEHRFTVAMVDIDHFKKFNDTHGHGGGDEALRLVAQTLRKSCRESDCVARYGGEEFALILPGVRSSRAADLLERIRRVVAATPIRLTGRAKPVSVTVSIGVASWPEDGATGAEVLSCADRRLYQAKQQGRDQVVGPPPARPRSLEEQARDEPIGEVPSVRAPGA